MQIISTEKFEPLYDRVLVQRIEVSFERADGIIISESMKEKPCEGRVIAAGAGRVAIDGTIRPLAVKEGDKVVFGKFAGTAIKAGENEYLLMREEDILGIIR